MSDSGPLPLLSPDAVVVRGGQNREPAIVVRRVNEAIDDGDGPVVSVYISDALPEEDHTLVIQRICGEADIRHGQIQLSTLGRLLAEGFGVLHEVGDGEPLSHHHVYFEEPVEESQAGRFIACFARPIPNPVRTGGEPRR